jgi:hypothetical protein
VHIIDGRVRHAVLLELFTDQGVGTEVHRDVAASRAIAVATSRRQSQSLSQAIRSATSVSR